MNGVLLAAGIASLLAAFDRGDLDEAARQGELAGPVVVEIALASSQRTEVLAGIAGSALVEDGGELLPALAKLAAGPDRRTAIPAARAALSIARRLAAHELPDDLTADDIASWRAAWVQLAAARDHFVEARVLALDVASTLAHAADPSELGFELPPFLADHDPAIRATAISSIPQPTPAALRGPLVAVVIGDADPHVALTAAQALCADLVADDPKPILDALGTAGIDRIRTLVDRTGERVLARDAQRCLGLTSDQPKKR